jgi:hypothetical protein
MSIPECEWRQVVDARTPAVPIYFPTTFRRASLILSCQPGPAS